MTETVGVLALQGDFREHIFILRSIGADAIEVRTPADLAKVSRLVIPGGESTVIDKLSRIFEVAEPIKQRIKEGMPVYGTCAGLIMLASEIGGAMDGQQNFGGMDVTVERNAFGAQLESFETDLDFKGIEDAPVKAVFIRAPIVSRVGDKVEVLSSLPNGDVVAVRQNNLLGTSFHPEISGDSRVHEYFLNM
ncbi:MAG: pyridoxal 5'-phosphate synthase glutaminase subunit PdxT [Microbacteriaceae bacterium]|nr:pyridoxal 5'-phosphate synthase glutaminase subunit PdxT [Microbacteriaceae bacterium]